eukprot:Gb_39578 [translate_table: standard]
MPGGGNNREYARLCTLFQVRCSLISGCC